MKSLKASLSFLQKGLTFKYDIVAPIVATILVLISGTFVSFMLAQNQSSENAAERQNQSREESQQVIEGVTRRLRSYEQIIVSGSSLIKISGDISREQWREFVNLTSLQEELLVDNAIGYIEKVSRTELPEFEAALKDEGFAPDGVFPPSAKATYFPVKFIEPLEGINPSIIGYDLYSEELRRSIAMSARDASKVSLTPPLLIPTENEGVSEVSVAAIFPVYQRMSNPQDASSREQNLKGYTFVAINMNQLGEWLSNRVLADERHAFRLSDVTDDHNDFIYETENFPSLLSQSASARDETFSALGREWRLEFVLSDSQANFNTTNPLLIFGVGMILNAVFAAFLLILMIHRQAKTAMSHKQEVQQTKDDLLALASHQLRTPATGVKQYLGMVLGGYAGDISKEQEVMLKRADESNERQLEIINQLLYVAKADAGQLKVDAERFDLVKVVREVIDEQAANAKSKGSTVKLHGKKPLLVDADLRHVRMIVENLVSNAIKYSFDESEVEVYFSDWRYRTAVHVSDKGVGISEDEKSQLFQKFTRINNKLSKRVGGSGIGLFLAQQLAHANGGEIVVETKSKIGSTFTLHLPKKSKK